MPVHKSLFAASIITLVLYTLEAILLNDMRSIISWPCVGYSGRNLCMGNRNELLFLDESMNCAAGHDYRAVEVGL